MPILSLEEMQEQIKQIVREAGVPGLKAYGPSKTMARFEREGCSIAVLVYSWGSTAGYRSKSSDGQTRTTKASRVVAFVRLAHEIIQAEQGEA